MEFGRDVYILSMYVGRTVEKKSDAFEEAGLLFLGLDTFIHSYWDFLWMVGLAC